MSWRRFIGIVGVVVMALFLASLSGNLYQRMGSEYVRYEGAGTEVDSMQVMTGGWPLPFLEDKPYAFSPANSVNVSDGMRGLDRFHVRPFLGNVALYALAILGIYAMAKRSRR
jgi:hypothetical protein